MCGDLPLGINWDALARLGDGFSQLGETVDAAAAAMRAISATWFELPPDPMDPEAGKHRWESYGRSATQIP